MDCTNLVKNSIPDSSRQALLESYTDTTDTHTHTRTHARACIPFLLWYMYISHTNITKTRLFKYTENFLPPKNENFQIKNSDIFHSSAQNIDCGYSLEPPHRGGSNEYHNLCFEQK